MEMQKLLELKKQMRAFIEIVGDCVSKGIITQDIANATYHGLADYVIHKANVVNNLEDSKAYIMLPAPKVKEILKEAEECIRKYSMTENS